MNKLMPYIICLAIAIIFFFAGYMFNQSKTSIAENIYNQNNASNTNDAKNLADENLEELSGEIGQWMVGKIISIKDKELLIQNVVDKKEMAITIDENTIITLEVIEENKVLRKPGVLRDLKTENIINFLLKDAYAKEIVYTEGQTGGTHQNK